jgi:tetratricopeptide (TPR) repeat protein
VQSVAFSPDGTRIVTGGWVQMGPPGEGTGVATVWDANSGMPLVELKGQRGGVRSAAFSQDGTRIVTQETTQESTTMKVWDARTGKELPGEAIPKTVPNERSSPDGRFLARLDGNRVELVRLEPDSDELAHRRLHMEPNFGRYRESYQAARAARDDFAAGFYLNLLPPAERKAVEAQADERLFTTLSDLVNRHLQTGKREQAVTVLVELWNLKKAKRGPEHDDTLDIMTRLGQVHWQMRQFDRSVPLLEEVFKIREKKLRADHPQTLRAGAELGVNYKDAGKLKEAIPLLEKAHRAVKKDRSLAWVTDHLFDAYVKAGEKAKLVALIQELLAEARKALPKDSPQLAQVLAVIGLHLLQAKAFAEAEPLLRECLAIREAKEPDDWRTFNTQSMLGGALLGQRKYAEAEPLLLAGYEGMKKQQAKIPPPGRPRLAEAVERLVHLYEALKKKDEVARWTKEREALKAQEKPK